LAHSDKGEKPKPIYICIYMYSTALHCTLSPVQNKG